MKPCPDCRRELSERASRCPHCGWQKARWPAVVLVLLLIGMALVIALVMYQTSETDRAAEKLEHTLGNP